MTKFDVGKLYSSNDISRSLQVGNAGGIRVGLADDSSVRRVVLLTSLPSVAQVSENPYHDRIEGETLIYTGTGKEGNQTLAGANKRIPQQFDDRFPIYGFQIVGSRRNPQVGPKRWRFLGLLQYLRHYREFELDTRGDLRSVWKFELLIHSEPSTVAVSFDREVVEAIDFKRAWNELERDVVFHSTESDSSNSQDAIRIERERRRLLSLEPNEFEHVIRNALIATGYDRVHVTKYSQDGGIDVSAYAGELHWPLQNLLIQIQAKRWLHTVGRKEVAELRGSLDQFARGAIVTTSHFSRAAIAEAEHPGKNPIVLVDGHSFSELCLRIGNE